MFISKLVSQWVNRLAFSMSLSEYALLSRLTFSLSLSKSRCWSTCTFCMYLVLIPSGTKFIPSRLFAQTDIVVIFLCWCKILFALAISLFCRQCFACLQCFSCLNLSLALYYRFIFYNHLQYIFVLSILNKLCHVKLTNLKYAPSVNNKNCIVIYHWSVIMSKLLNSTSPSQFNIPNTCGR